MEHWIAVVGAGVFVSWLVGGSRHRLVANVVIGVGSLAGLLITGCPLFGLVIAVWLLELVLGGNHP
jgi:hypothetical protein